MCTYTCSYIGRMFLLVGKNVCKKTHRCLFSKDTHLADNGFININPCIIHMERQIATPHKNYCLFQHIFFTLIFLAPKTTLCMKSAEMPALSGKIFEIVLLSIRKCWQNNHSKAKQGLHSKLQKNIWVYQRCIPFWITHTTIHYVPRAWQSLLKSSSHKMYPWGFYLHW